MFEVVSIVWWILIIPSLLILNVIFILTLAIEMGPYWFRIMIQIIFTIAWVLHGLESVIAFILCSYVNESDSRFDWTFQTFLLGYPSLRLLIAKKK